MEKSLLGGGGRADKGEQEELGSLDLRSMLITAFMLLNSFSLFNYCYKPSHEMTASLDVD